MFDKWVRIQSTRNKLQEPNQYNSRIKIDMDIKQK